MSNIEEGREVTSMNVESGTAALISRSEIDMQIATAHKFPRSIKRFRNEALQMVTLNEQVAESCIYALPRGDKTIDYGRVMEVMGTISAAGYNKVALVAELPEPPTPAKTRAKK